jgi:hypothetical protein
VPQKGTRDCWHALCSIATVCLDVEDVAQGEVVWAEYRPLTAAAVTPGCSVVARPPGAIGRALYLPKVMSILRVLTVLPRRFVLQECLSYFCIPLPEQIPFVQQKTLKRIGQPTQEAAIG